MGIDNVKLIGIFESIHGTWDDWNWNWSIRLQEMRFSGSQHHEKKKKENRRAKNHALFVCECVSIFAPVGLTKARASCIVKARLSSNQWNVSPKLKKKKEKKNIRKRNNYHRQAFLLINNIQKEGNIRVISRWLTYIHTYIYIIITCIIIYLMTTVFLVIVYVYRCVCVCVNRRS